MSTAKLKEWAKKWLTSELSSTELLEVAAEVGGLEAENERLTRERDELRHVFALSSAAPFESLLKAASNVVTRAHGYKTTDERATGLNADAMREERVAELEKAATAFVARMEFVTQHPRYQSVWHVSQLHTGPYDGPKYEAEFYALKEALKAALASRVRQQKPDSARESER